MGKKHSDAFNHLKSSLKSSSKVKKRGFYVANGGFHVAEQAFIWCQRLFTCGNVGFHVAQELEWFFSVLLEYQKPSYGILNIDHKL